jgi:hypothetical protein
MASLKDTDLYTQTLENRLQESEAMLSKAKKLADEAYLFLSQGDLKNCQDVIGELIQSMSEHFYEEVH